DDDEYDDPNSRFTNTSGSRRSSSSEPLTKIRKKPGRKPNPASPAIRKEQNRAAQRAFRDRKERHLHEMESSIMELKNINSQITQRSRQDAERFKAALESLQGENYYLRQVIFSFEATLSKGGNMAIIQQVKAELYHRHYEKHTAKKRSGTSWPTRATQPPVPTTPSVFLPDGIPLFQLDSEGTSQQSREQILDQAIAAATTTISSKFTTATSDSSPYSSDVPISPLTFADPEDNNMFPVNNNQDVFPSKRLRLEIQVLASAPPAVDLNIDPKIYALPHDPRIDLIPCPRLRAQLILHRKKYNIDELSKVLINGAICHGHPLDPHSWELPEVFFDRYGFLLGEEMLRHRNKIWPKKDELQLGNELGRVRHEHS
ncbi:hypothetical protein EDD21DRAFT_310039, partial [Dissophora ornata]